MASDDFVGAVRLFCGNFAIVGTAMCQGQLMAISQNTALFSLLGTTYGGDGRTTFGLPDLRGRVPIGQGQGAGLTDRFIGESSGSENVTLLTSTVPGHTHTLNATTALTTTDTAGPGVLTGTLNASDGEFYTNPSMFGFATLAMNAGAVASMGGSLPHNNIQPSLAINFLINLQGIFPSRN